MTSTDLLQRVERISPPNHARWIEIGEAQNEAFLQLLRSLDASDWSKSTDCSRWTVKDIVAHVLGTAEGFTSMSELRHQMGASKKLKGELGNQLNAMNEVQVIERRDVAPEDLIARLESTFERFIKLRRRVGGVGKVLPIYDASVLGLTTARYLFDTILARDIFMHRVDISRAVDRAVELIPEDRELVEDVVRDWARRAKPDVHLELTGPAGDSFAAGDASQHVSADAVEFCRVLSGRGSTTDFAIVGDRTAAERWLAVPCPF